MPEESEFDIAAKKAKKDFDELKAKMSPEEQVAIEKLSTWWKANYLASGHKRLGRIIAGTFRD